MAVHANSTTAPARPLLPPTAPAPASLRDARGRFARRVEPLLAAGAPEPATLDDVRREMEALLAVGAVALEDASEAIGLSASAASGLSADAAAEEITPAPLPPLGPALSRRRAIFGAVTPAAPEHDAPTARPTPDLAFAAVRAFDRVVAEWDAAFAEHLGIMDALDPRGLFCWDDPPAVARAVLGPIAGSTVAALDRLSRRMGALDARHEAAEARLLSTRAASEIGAAALRACVRRYARRPLGSRSDEAVMLGRLAA